jgi:peptidoglycan/xylan/chitin deacetylase (PgdA/CDA1 family)
MPAFSWPQNRKAALSLTYDDALSCHHRSVAPLLQRHGLRGTFYAPICSRFLQESDAWRQVAKDGHELGNHTLFHPCYGAKRQDIAWLDAGYNLRDYSPKRWHDEVTVANWALQQVAGQTRRTFGNTCHNRWIGDGDSRLCLDTLILEHFVAARGGNTGRAVDPAAPDFTNLGTQGADRRSFDELRAELSAVREAGAWMIYTMHAVGPGESVHFTEEAEHRQLVEWLASQTDFWVAPVVEIATWLKGNATATGAAGLAAGRDG